VPRAPRVNSPAGEKHLHLLFIPKRHLPFPGPCEGEQNCADSSQRLQDQNQRRGSKAARGGAALLVPRSLACWRTHCVALGGSGPPAAQHCDGGVGRELRPQSPMVLGKAGGPRGRRRGACVSVRVLLPTRWFQFNTASSTLPCPPIHGEQYLMSSGADRLQLKSWVCCLIAV